MSWGVPDEMVIKDTVPFMAVKEYEYIRDLINSKNYKTALEWGAGSSTIWFPENTNVEYWVSIEHNKKYVDYLKDKVCDKVNLLHIEDKNDYVNAAHGLLGRPVQLGKIEYEKNSFDFILIDGLYRDECLDKAMELRAEGGTIILHDSGRAAYKDWYSKYPYKTIFEGEGWLGDGWDHRGLCEF